MDPAKPMSTAEMLTMVLDWHHKMKLKGHAPAWSFDPTLVYRMYHKYKATRSLTSAELSALNNIVYGKPSGRQGKGWSIVTWAAEHYPEDRGIAPEPPQDGTATVDEQLQGVLDWLHHARPADFDPELVHSLYHQHQKGRALTDNQRGALWRIANRRLVREWQQAHYPRLKGTAPPPADPAAEGCLILMSDEDD